MILLSFAAVSILAVLACIVIIVKRKSKTLYYNNCFYECAISIILLGNLLMSPVYFCYAVEDCYFPSKYDDLAIELVRKHEDLEFHCSRKVPNLGYCGTFELDGEKVVGPGYFPKAAAAYYKREKQKQAQELMELLK